MRHGMTERVTDRRGGAAAATSTTAWGAAAAAGAATTTACHIGSMGSKEKKRYINLSTKHSGLKDSSFS